MVVFILLFQIYTCISITQQVEKILCLWHGQVILRGILLIFPLLIIAPSLLLLPMPSKPFPSLLMGIPLFFFFSLIVHSSLFDLNQVLCKFKYRTTQSTSRLLPTILFFPLLLPPPDYFLNTGTLLGMFHIICFSLSLLINFS